MEMRWKVESWPLMIRVIPFFVDSSPKLSGYPSLRVSISGDREPFFESRLLGLAINHKPLAARSVVAQLAQA